MTRRLPLLIAALLTLSGCQVYEDVRTELVVAPPVPVPTVPVAAGAVSVHLATFRQPGQEQAEWFRITRDFPTAGEYQPRLVLVPDPLYTRLYELYIDEVPGAQAASLCSDMMMRGSYCAILATSLSQTTPDLTAPMMAPPTEIKPAT
jgi:hypothetical protein